MSSAKKKIEANASALILREVIRSSEGKNIKVKDIEDILKEEPFNMTSLDAEREVRNVSGVQFKGHGEDEIISSFSLQALASVQKTLHSRIRINDLLPEEVFKKLKGEKVNVNKVALVMGLMDHLGMYIYQEQMYQVLMEAGLDQSKARNAITTAINLKKFISKPHLQKGALVVLAPGSEHYKGEVSFIRLYDLITNRRIKESLPEEREILVELHTDQISFYAEDDSREVTIRIIRKEGLKEEVIKGQVKEMAAHLIKL